LLRKVASVGLWLVLVLVPPHVLCAGSPAIHLLVTGAKQNSPLQIVGFKLPTVSGGAPKIRVHNATNKEVSQFEMTILWGDPRGKDAGGPRLGGINAAGCADCSYFEPPGPIPGNGDGESKEEASLKPSTLVLFALGAGGSCLHVAVMVDYVRFSDGIVWHASATNKYPAEMANDQPFWKDSILPESAASCDDSPEFGEVLKGASQGRFLRGAIGPDLNAPLNPASSGPLKFYTAACPVHATRKPTEGSPSVICYLPCRCLPCCILSFARSSRPVNLSSYSFRRQCLRRDSATYTARWP
jgi:hypothetical protein